MARIRINVTTDLTPLKRADADLRSSLGGGGSGNRSAMDSLKLIWAKRYESFIRRRFNQYSRGGGDWPPLSPRTIAARRPPARRKSPGRGGGVRRSKPGVGVKPSRQASILRDTGTLYGALSIGAPGNLYRNTQRGFVYGFAGAQHTSGSATIAQIAAWHDEGAGRLPKRTILVQPDTATQRAMARDAVKAVADAINAHGGTVRRGGGRR